MATNISSHWAPGCGQLPSWTFPPLLKPIRFVEILALGCAIEKLDLQARQSKVMPILIDEYPELLRNPGVGFLLAPNGIQCLTGFQFLVDLGDLSSMAFWEIYNRVVLDEGSHI